MPEAPAHYGPFLNLIVVYDRVFGTIAVALEV